MRRPAAHAPALALCGLALACGGGGSGGGSGATAEITSDNATTIASDVLGAIFLSADLSRIAESLPDLFPSAAGAAANEETPARRGFAAARRALADAGARPLPRLPGGVSASAAVGPITQSCAGGGTVTISGDIAGPLPTRGDRVSASFTNCQEEEDAPPLNGAFRYTITALTGNVQDLFSAVLTFTFDAFASGDASEREQVDGDATTFFDNTGMPVVRSSATDDMLRFRSESDDDPNQPPPPDVVTLTLRTYDTQLSQNLNDEEYTIDARGRVAGASDPPPPPGADYTGQVSYDVTAALAGALEGDDASNPSEGTVLVSGDASAMRIVVVDDANVKLELDLDDDGTAEQTLDTTWSALGF